jgi:SAM-dependent methyltransferase
MDHRDHVRLLRGTVAGRHGTWADIGAGEGAFTFALAELLDHGSAIVAVDRDRSTLEHTVADVQRAFSAIEVRALAADFREPLPLPRLDGLVMANALHFVERSRQANVVRALARHLRPAAPFVLVEYDATRATRGSRTRSRPRPGPGWRGPRDSSRRNAWSAYRAGSSAGSTRRSPGARRRATSARGDLGRRDLSRG